MFLLYHARSRPTGRQLAGLLGIRGWRGIRRAEGPCVLRWGTAQHSHIDSLIQPASAIARAGNKLVALRTMRDAGVPVPEFRDVEPTEGRWMGRKTHGSGGRDIRVWTGPTATWDGCDFYTRYIPNTREYRVHVAFGNVIRVQGKYLDFPEQHNIPEIKNYAQGFRFRTPELRLNQSRLDAAVHAVNCLGLDFGAVDLLIGEDRNEYVLEVNTAPALAPRTAAEYVAAIRNHLGEIGIYLGSEN